MQKGFKKDLLKILKSHRNLQKSVPKAGRNNLNDFRNNSEPLKNLFKSFENASEREVEPWDSSEDLDKNQFKTE